MLTNEKIKEARNVNLDYKTIAGQTNKQTDPHALRQCIAGMKHYMAYSAAQLICTERVLSALHGLQWTHSLHTLRGFFKLSVAVL